MNCLRLLVPLHLPLALAILLAPPRVAAASDGIHSPAAEIRALDAQIAEALSTHGCAVACQALGSMARAADRVCAIDPGPSCDDARARVRDAQRRVHEACPECGAADGDVSPPEQAAKKPAPPPEPPPPSAPSAMPAAEMVVSAPRRGGCAGCVVGGEGGTTEASVIAALSVIAVLARRRRRQ